MASGTTATSKVTPVTLGTSVRNRSQVFTATKVTETVDASGKKSFNVELVKFSDAKGSSPTTFGTRDANGNITFNNNASAKDKQFAQAHLRASKSQMESVKDKFELDSEGQKKFNQQNGNANKSSADNPQGDGSNPTSEESTPFDSEKFASNVKSVGRNNFKQNGVLVYPADIGKTNQDVIKFDMLQYKPKKFSDTDFGFSSRTRNTDKKGQIVDSIGTVVLPIPAGISDTNSAQWGGEPMNAKDAELSRLALSGITGGGDGAVDSVKSTVDKISSGSGEVKTAVAAMFGEAATGVTGLLARTTGAVLNPNLELLFQGPTLRPFNFTFKMSSRDDKEAQTIIKIIRFFKQGMSPQRSSSNLFLKSPHTFKIRYMMRGQNGQEHPYIGKIKECALQNFTVNYTPEGQYATFRDGVLVSYEIQMTFQELEPIFNNDYTDLDSDKDTQIGY